MPHDSTHPVLRQPEEGPQLCEVNESRAHCMMCPREAAGRNRHVTCPISYAVTIGTSVEWKVDGGLRDFGAAARMSTCYDVTQMAYPDRGRPTAAGQRAGCPCGRDRSSWHRSCRTGRYWLFGPTPGMWTPGFMRLGSEQYQRCQWLDCRGVVSRR